MIFFFLAVIALHFCSDWVISTFAYKPVFAPHLLTLKTFALLLGWISLAILWVRKYHTCHVKAVGGCETLSFLSCFKLQEVMVVGWESEGWRRVFLFFPPLCVHLAVHDYSPQYYWGISKDIHRPICHHFTASDNLTHFKNSTIALNQGSDPANHYRITEL